MSEVLNQLLGMTSLLLSSCSSAARRGLKQRNFQSQVLSCERDLVESAQVGVQHFV